MLNCLINQLHSPQRGRREERQQQRRRSPRAHDFSAVCSFRLEEENPGTGSGSDFAYLTHFRFYLHLNEFVNIFKALKSRKLTFSIQELANR